MSKANINLECEVHKMPHTMTDFERINERAMEIENRLDDVRAEVKCISESIISLSETLGNATSNLYDLMSMLDEMNELEANDGRYSEADT